MVSFFATYVVLTSQPTRDLSANGQRFFNLIFFPSMVGFFLAGGPHNASYSAVMLGGSLSEAIAVTLVTAAMMRGWRRTRSRK